MKKKYFRLYACCIPVKGYNRSMITDIQLKDSFFIPNILLDILDMSEMLSISEIKRKFSRQKHSYINEYFTFLIEKDLGFYCEKFEIDEYPKLNLEWKRPEKITNAIIDSDKHIYITKKVIEQLDEVDCKALQIRFYQSLRLNKLYSVINLFGDSRLRHIDILLKYHKNITKEVLTDIINRCPRIQFIVIHSSPNLEMINIQNIRIKYVTINIDNKSHCGIVDEGNLLISQELFIEAQKHNTCLNRKISIDTEGYIRNCPSMPEHYGNIKDTTLQEAMQHPDFKKYWFINKDQIEVCKDCEFRYICTDCRAYREDPENLLSKPLKCGYNPYTCEWEEWSTNPLKQKAIDYYGMREMVSKTEQLS